MTKVRVRFAPSPTGHLHIGGLRTALFNFLYARHYNGDFLLRIEDTDRERSLEKYTEEFITSLEWAGITADEPIVIQSQRIDEHMRLAQQLLDAGKAYRCYCASDAQASADTFFKYAGTCRQALPTDVDKPFVIRIKLSEASKKIAFHDLIRGPIEFDQDQFDDFIIVRSDGSPMYNFVVVADDAAMGITHVIRGEEHISNTPKQLMLYEALGFAAPRFAHLPLILSPSGQKLSKRDAAVAVIDYKKKGYLADALCNYLARLGWSHGDQELFSRSELIQFFTLEGIGKKGAIFDAQKLDWVNSVYLKKKSAAEILVCIEADVEPGWRARYASISDERMFALIDLYKDRVATLKQLVDEVTLLFEGPSTYSQEDCAKYVGAQTVNYLAAMLKRFDSLSEFSEQDIQENVKTLAQESGVPLVKLAQPLRLSLLGKAASPGVFALMSLLGKEETVRRLCVFKDVLSSISQKKE